MARCGDRDLGGGVCTRPCSSQRQAQCLPLLWSTVMRKETNVHSVLWPFLKSLRNTDALRPPTAPALGCSWRWVPKALELAIAPERRTFPWRPADGKRQVRGKEYATDGKRMAKPCPDPRPLPTAERDAGQVPCPAPRSSHLCGELTPHAPRGTAFEDGRTYYCRELSVVPGTQ